GVDMDRYRDFASRIAPLLRRAPWARRQQHIAQHRGGNHGSNNQREHTRIVRQLFAGATELLEKPEEVSAGTLYSSSSIRYFACQSVTDCEDLSANSAKSTEIGDLEI